MWLPTCRSVLLSTILACAALACSENEEPKADAAKSSGSGQVGCASDPRVSTFASGLVARSTSGRFSAEIVTASPSPPQRGAGDAGVNTWTMRFVADGKPLGPEAVVTATTLMPDHGHGSPKVPTVTPSGDGTYAVTGLYLFMGGVWEVKFSADPNEVATFSICVD